jgi:hypothetical protein
MSVEFTLEEVEEIKLTHFMKKAGIVNLTRIWQTVTYENKNTQLSTSSLSL